MPLTKNPTLIFTKIPAAADLLVEGVHVKVEDRPLDIDNVPLGAGRVIVKIVVISSDPYMRYRFREKDVPMFCPPILLGEP
jgi:NADPH-dependent curcumin reductase CurA